MAVATHTKGRDLDPYVRLVHGDQAVLVAPGLTPLAAGVRVSVARWVTKGFRVEFVDPAACSIEDRRGPAGDTVPPVQHTRRAGRPR